MSYILYTAPSCLRCKIVKEFMGEHGMSYEQFDFKADKDIFNNFYRANRPSIYRNPEGVEFPVLHDDSNNVIKQGSGEIIAYLLSGHILEACVTRSDLLHGWISGLYVSQCPPEEDENFLTLVRALAKGGLQVYLQSDGRRPELLEKILSENLVSKMVLNIPGPAEVYPYAVGGEISQSDLKKSIELVKTHKDHLIRLFLTPLTPPDSAPCYLTTAQAGEAAKMVFEACGDMQLPFAIQVSDQSAEGLEALNEGNLLPYRSKVRNHLVKADILKAAAH